MFLWVLVFGIVVVGVLLVVGVCVYCGCCWYWWIIVVILFDKINFSGFIRLLLSRFDLICSCYFVWFVLLWFVGLLFCSFWFDYSCTVCFFVLGWRDSVSLLVGWLGLDCFVWCVMFIRLWFVYYVVFAGCLLIVLVGSFVFSFLLFCLNTLLCLEF